MKTTIAAALTWATCLAQSVTIVNSGSTNTAGFRIVVEKSGYEDVKTAGRLSSLPPQRCVKSASFGTRLTIQFGDDTSPDLSCGDGGDAKMRALIRDTTAIVKSFRAP